MGHVAVAQPKTRKKVRRFTAVRQRVARKQSGQTIRFQFVCACARMIWRVNFRCAGSGITTAGLPPPTDIQVGGLGAVKECHKRACSEQMIREQRVNLQQCGARNAHEAAD